MLHHFLESGVYGGQIPLYVLYVAPRNELRFAWAREEQQRLDFRVRTPRLNGKVERSHGTDQQEFYQLLTYTNDVDLNEKLEE